MFRVRALPPSTSVFCKAMAVLALLSASIDILAPVPENRLLRSASNSALPSLITGEWINVS
ncbi:hypothetical protein D3C76_1860520 [compost metagenome]